MCYHPNIAVTSGGIWATPPTWRNIWMRKWLLLTLIYPAVMNVMFNAKLPCSFLVAASFTKSLGGWFKKRAPTEVLWWGKQINKSGTKLQDSHCAAAFYMRMTLTSYSQYVWETQMLNAVVISFVSHCNPLQKQILTLNLTVIVSLLPEKSTRTW